MSRFRHMLVAAGLVGLVGALMVLGEGATWPGADSGCVAAADCYCEGFRSEGFAAQPANTVSNLAFVAVGMWVLADAGRRRAAGWTFAYGWVAVAIGVGSALFHGTMTSWAGWADLVAMYLFISLYLTINLAEIAGWSSRRAATTFVLGAGALAIAQVPLSQGAGKYIFGTLVVFTALTETRIRGRDRRLLWGAIGLFAISFVAWNLSRTGGAWCSPDSLAQGHALWHVGSALAIAILYRYLRQALVEA